MSAEVFSRTREVQERHLDGLGHVNNAVWVRFVVELAEAHASSRGFGGRKVRELGAQWIVRRHEIDYRASALAGEEIVEETWVESMKGARSIRHSRFTRARDGALLVSAVTHWAYTSAETQRPRRIDPQILAAFGG